MSTGSESLCIADDLWCLLHLGAAAADGRMIATTLTVVTVVARQLVLALALIAPTQSTLANMFLLAILRKDQDCEKIQLLAEPVSPESGKHTDSSMAIIRLPVLVLIRVLSAGLTSCCLLGLVVQVDIHRLVHCYVC